MMKKLTLLLTFGILIAAAGEIQAQSLLKKLSNKAKEAVENKIEEKAEEKVEEEVDKKVDEAIDEAEEGQTEENQTEESRGMERLQGMLGRMGMDATPVTIEDSYTFTSNIKMKIESFKANGSMESSGTVNSFFNQSDDSFAYEMANEKGSNQGTAFIIYDQKNKASIMLSDKDGKKTGIATGINLNMEDEDASSLEEMGNHDLTALNERIKKTGRTKTILGYKCQEYVYKDEEVESSIWMANDKDWKVNHMLSAIYKSSQYSSGFPAGFMMEMESTNLQTKEKNTMKVVEVNDHIKKVVSLSDYEVANMGSFQMGGME